MSATSPWKAMGCVLIVIAGASVGLELAGPPYNGISPVDLVLPSRVPEDALLQEALLRALTNCPDGPLPMHDPGHSYAGVVEVRLESCAQFVPRLRSVPGWDHIAILGPMESGQTAAADPRFESARVRRQLKASQMGISDIFFFQMLVVRGEDIVARPIIYLPCSGSFSAEGASMERVTLPGEPSRWRWIIDAEPAHAAGIPR